MISAPNTASGRVVNRGVRKSRVMMVAAHVTRLVT